MVQQSLPETEVPAMSDLDCLNLNICVPRSVGLPTATRKLPVLVYVHGGAFLFGSNWYPHYVQDKFVELAERKGTPVITVIFKYALLHLPYPSVEGKLIGRKLPTGLAGSFDITSAS